MAAAIQFGPPMLSPAPTSPASVGTAPGATAPVTGCSNTQRRRSPLPHPANGASPFHWTLVSPWALLPALSPSLSFSRDGFTYERAAITEWLRTNSTSPSTGALLESTTLIPNHLVRSLLRTFNEAPATAPS